MGIVYKGFVEKSINTRNPILDIVKFEFRDDKYIYRIRVATYNFMEDGISIIYEKRKPDGRIIEVWHLILSNRGKFVHKHRKYPSE